MNSVCAARKLASRDHKESKRLISRVCKQTRACLFLRSQVSGLRTQVSGLRTQVSGLRTAAGPYAWRITHALG
ncbi:hypothetical protein BMS3Bbin04_00567 [bacterium BMS3Bbin04]|nr:hypothetical protein BMS3Bbin04_00567 [bacterium BMS3Bbin04]